MRWLFVVLIACGDRDATQLDAVKREVCACDSVACADAAMKKLPKGGGDPSHREQGIARDIVDCYAKLQEAAKPQLPE